MDTEGPISVLDRRPRSSSRDKIIADRITRQRSPGPSFRHHRGRRVPSQERNVGEEEAAQDVIYRISQPYRTSFSAKHSVTWGKVDRSRSLSPTSSLRSDTSRASAPPIFYSGGDKRRPRGRSKSPKRVTYNSKVIVRHSDTEDSMFTELSSHECDEEDLVPMRPIVSPFSRALISPRYNEFSQLSPISVSSAKSAPDTLRPRVRDVTNMMHNASLESRQGDVSNDSGLDYSTELKDLSDQITKMQWSPRQNRVILGKPPPGSGFRLPSRSTPTSNPSPHGILKDSQNSKVISRDNPVPASLNVGNGFLNGSAHNGGTNYSNNQTTSGWSANGSPKGKENDPRSSPQKAGCRDNHDPTMRPVDTTEYIARDYEHNQLFSYTDALKGHYGEDISKLAKEGLLQSEQTRGSSPTVDKGATENGGLHISGQVDLPLVINTNHHPVDDLASSSSPADTSLGESSPARAKNRGSPVQSGRLTPSKRSVSLSITNFFKKVSPHFRRKKSKDRPNQTRSAEGSAQSLANTTSDPDTDRESPTNNLTEKPKRSSKFSRSQVRQSFMKLMGRSSSKSKKKNKNQPGDIIPTPSHYTIELQDPEKNTSSDEVDEITNGFMLNSNENLGRVGFDPSTHPMMKSIEQNTLSEQDIYRRFKERQSSREMGDTISDSDFKTTPAGLAKPEPIRPTSLDNSYLDHSTSDFMDGPMDFFTESDISAILRPDLDRSYLKAAYFGTPEKKEEVSPSRVEPPKTLDVLPVRTKRLMQTSVMSSISGDESIGECSLNANLT
ncbi:disks large-associated protein 4, partial [Biomphalaria pfeifferi]